MSKLSHSSTSACGGAPKNGQPRPAIGQAEPHSSGAAPEPARLIDVSRRFILGGALVQALTEINLDFPAGQFTAILGRSGSGKSTLMNLLAGIDRPSSGRVLVAGHDLATAGDDTVTLLRRDHIGVVYQFFNLLPTLSVRENVALPALLAGESAAVWRPRAEELLQEVGLQHRAEARPHTLSGGEMQRTAVARALMRSPELVLADEPAGNLDSRTADQVYDLLADLPRRYGCTLILVTHSEEAAAMAGRIIRLADGRVASDTAAG